MRAVETIARALASAHCDGMYGTADPDGESTARRQRDVDRRWPSHQHEAARLLRALKDQPPHITDAGVQSPCIECDPGEALDAMLEAMARA